VISVSPGAVCSTAATIDLHHTPPSLVAGGVSSSVCPELAALLDRRPRWEVPALYARAVAGDRYSFAVLLLRGHDAAWDRPLPARLALAVKALDTVHRRYLVLHCLAGLGVPEMAELLGRPAPAVMGVLHRARVLLGDALPAGWVA